MSFTSNFYEKQVLIGLDFGLLVKICCFFYKIGSRSKAKKIQGGNFPLLTPTFAARWRQLYRQRYQSFLGIKY